MKLTLGGPERLLNRNFFLLWQGQLISAFGTQVSVVATLLWVKQATGSATLMATLALMTALPALIIGPLGGTFADRYSRRKILVISDLLNGCLALTLAALLWLIPERIDIILVFLAFHAFGTAALDSFFRPAIAASIPDLVPAAKLESANALSASSGQFALLFGQGLGGLLFQTLGAPLLFFLDGLSYWSSAASESFIAVPQRLPERSPSWRQAFSDFWQAVVAGFDYVWGRRNLRLLFFAAAALNIFTVPIFLLMPFYVEDVLKLSASWYGFMVGAFGVGSLVGYGLASTLQVSARTKSALMSAAMIFVPLMFGGLSVARLPVLCMLLMLCAGLSIAFISTMAMSIIQVATPSEMRGRVFGLLETISRCLNPLAIAITGILADLIERNIPLVYGTCGALLLLVTLGLLSSRELRTFLEQDRRSVTEDGLCTAER